MDRITWQWSEGLQRYVLEVLLEKEKALIHLHQEEQPVGMCQTEEIIRKLRDGWYKQGLDASS